MKGGVLFVESADKAARFIWLCDAFNIPLIYLSDVPGIMRDPLDKESLIPSVNAERIEQLIEEEIVVGGMIPKVESAMQALAQGVKKIHFIDGRTPHALLLEIFTNTGIGTEIVP